MLIFIGLLKWNEKENNLKPKRGKKVALQISNSAKSSLLRQKAEEKWKAYYRNLYNENQTYVLLYKDGQQVLFLPGTSEVFTLKRYHEEIGKDYNRIYLYLCTSDDYNNTRVRMKVHLIQHQITTRARIMQPMLTRVRVRLHLIQHQKTPSTRIPQPMVTSDYESTSHSAAKYAKLENTIALSTVGEQIKLDKKLARELDFQLNQDVLEDYQNSDNLTMQERSHNLVEQDKDAEQSVK